MERPTAEKTENTSRHHLQEAQELLQEARAQIAEGKNKEAASTLWDAFKKTINAYTISRERP